MQDLYTFLVHSTFLFHLFEFLFKRKKKNIFNKLLITNEFIIIIYHYPNLLHLNLMVSYLLLDLNTLVLDNHL